MQNRLGQLSRTLAIIAIVIVAFVFVVGLIANQPARLMLMTALSLAVAIVPEGLPAVATVALAIGARRMFQRNALIRQLPSVETLGSVSVICSDKTGTLTQNKMTATSLDVHNFHGEVDDSTESKNSSIQLLLVGSCLCNDAQLQQGHSESGNESTPQAVGEPTEKALVEVAAKLGLDQQRLQTVFPRIDEIAFDSQRKRMTTVHAIQASDLEPFPDFEFLKTHQKIAFVKGSVESLLEISSSVWINDRAEELDSQNRARIEQSRDEMASKGTRVLAVGFRPIETEPADSELETNLIFVGMIGLTDPPRPEAKIAVARCGDAGIRTIMITGDHPLTAKTIAGELGILNAEAVITGRELETMSVESLQKCVQTAAVFARVAPADKLHIVEALQHNKDVVAMTGDGVNDAPALKQANMGVAMGITGTDVSKEAANMVLLDDNFATIVAAVEQGRMVYDNVKKFVKYTMSSNTGEVLVMAVGVALGMPLPLLPLQILWVNLVTDGLPGLALAVEPAEENTMHRKPIRPDEAIFDRQMTFDVVCIGALIGAISLIAGSVIGLRETDVDHWRTVIFTVLTFAQMSNAIACRSDRSAFWKGNAKQNWWLWCALASTVLLQLAVIYLPPLQEVFHTRALSLFDLTVCLAFSASVFVLIELKKWLVVKTIGQF